MPGAVKGNCVIRVKHARFMLTVWAFVALHGKTRMDRDTILLTPGPLTTSRGVKLAMLADWGSWDQELRAVTADIRKRQRVVMNNLENVPYDALVFWAAFVSVLAQSIAGGGQQEALALNVLLPVYSASRVAFTVFYVRGMQPFRTISFVVGMCSVVSAAGVLLASAAKAYAL